MGYGDLSHTEVIISHKAKLIRIYETEVWDKSHILWVVVGLVLYSIEWQFQQKKRLKNLAMGYGNLSNGHQNTTDFLEVE